MQYPHTIEYPLLLNMGTAGVCTHTETDLVRIIDTSILQTLLNHFLLPYFTSKLHMTNLTNNLFKKCIVHSTNTY